MQKNREHKWTTLKAILDSDFQIVASLTKYCPILTSYLFIFQMMSTNVP